MFSCFSAYIAQNTHYSTLAPLRIITICNRRLINRIRPSSSITPRHGMQRYSVGGHLVDTFDDVDLAFIGPFECGCPYSRPDGAAAGKVGDIEYPD